MMRDTRRRRWATILLGGSVFSLLGGCPLPDRYFENTFRMIAFSIVDNAVNGAVQDVLGIALGGNMGANGMVPAVMSADPAMP